MPIVTGKCKWAKIFEGNRDFEYLEDGSYSIVLELDEKASAQLKADGIDVFHTQDGDEYTFKRNHSILKDGETIVLGPPAVVNRDLTPYDLKAQGLVGNGSTVSVLYKVFTPTKGKSKKTSGKLNAVQVIDHIVYKKPGGGNEAFTKVESDLDNLGFEKVS